MYAKGETYNVIATSGVYVLTIRVVNDKDINLLTKLAQIAKLELVKPFVKFSYIGGGGCGR